MSKIKVVRAELQRLINKHNATHVVLVSEPGITLPYTHNGVVYHIPADLTSYAKLLRFPAYDLSNIQTVDMTKLNFEGISSVQGMFFSCTELIDVKFPETMPEFDYLDMSDMFGRCKNLTKVDLTMFTVNMAVMTEAFPSTINTIGMPVVKKYISPYYWNGEDRYYVLPARQNAGEELTVIFPEGTEFTFPINHLFYHYTPGGRIPSDEFRAYLYIPQSTFDAMHASHYENLTDNVAIIIP